jgi:hypothetical protein
MFWPAACASRRSGMLKLSSDARFSGEYVMLKQRWKPPFYEYPRLGALFSFLMALLVLSVLEPWVVGTRLNWPWILGCSVLLGLNAYVLRIGTRRFVAIYLAAICVAAAGVYVIASLRLGVPAHGPERTWWAFVIALPILGSGLAGWMWTKASGPPN